MLNKMNWENHLLDLAHHAMNSEVIHHSITDAHNNLSSAYLKCEKITRENSKTFFVASSLMSEERRRATRALYAFCRVSDDLVDRPVVTDKSQTTASKLESWRGHVLWPGQPAGINAEDHEVAMAWADARRQYSIPNGYVEQLIDGLSFDLNRVRYTSFNELVHYCYGVACTVGLMSMKIVGYASCAAIPFAIRLGVALQLTNILRDVGEDWRAGRLYLPLEELDAFGLSETDVAAGKVDDRWRAFMRFQIQRTRRLYAEALPGISLLHSDGRFAIAAAGELYRAILDQIEANDYNVFQRRASLSSTGKLSRLPGIWWRSTYKTYTA
jgi:15-cis-phytoene synthase